MTDIGRSIRFYRDILRMDVQEPIDLKETTALLKFGHSLLSSGPKSLQKLAESACGHAYESMYTTVSFCSAGRSQNGLILVEQKNPKTNRTRSVSGNNIYGFSCYISADVDMEDLAWDLEKAGMNFVFGDTGTDGSVFSAKNAHSIFVRDPDGRMVELIQGTETGSFISRLGYPVLYVTNIDESRIFYQNTFGLNVLTGPKIVCDSPGKKMIPLGSDEPCILLYEETKSDGEKVKSGGFGLDHIALSGEKIQKITPVKSPPCLIMGSDKENQYILDPDGYCLEYYPR